MPVAAYDPDSALWARARDDYRAGVTAAEVCGRYGIGRSAFYARAQAERWRRADLPSAREAGPDDDFDPALPRDGAGELAEQAHRRLAHALGKGRLREALGWSRLARDLRALALEEDNMSWRRQRAAHREAETAAAAVAAAASDPADDTRAEKESPPALIAQTTDPAGETALQPDCPDDFQASGISPTEPDASEPMPGEVIAACREIIDQEPDPERAWLAVLPLLEGARPDLDWRGVGDGDEGEDEDPP